MEYTAHSSGLAGLRVVAFESRRASELAELIRRYGGEPLVAPSMREVPLSENTAAFECVRRIESGDVDVVVLMTGVGVRALAEVVSGERLAAALRRAVLVARGPKPVAALRELGLQPEIVVPAPNTWHEVLTTLDAELPVGGKRVAVQEYGVSNAELIAALGARGAEVQRIPIYRWALPDDLDPLHAAIRALCKGRGDIALFTSGVQVYHLFQVANDLVARAGGTERLRAAFATVLIASIGPVCSEALREHGLSPDLEPDHSKMGPLVGEVARRGRELLEKKRRQA